MIARCYTCNAYMADAYTQYQKLKVDQGFTTREALDRLQITRICCRTRIISYVNLYDEFRNFPCNDVVLDDAGSILCRKIQHSRRVSCDVPEITPLDVE